MATPSPSKLPPRRLKPVGTTSPLPLAASSSTSGPATSGLPPSIDYKIPSALQPKPNAKNILHPSPSITITDGSAAAVVLGDSSGDRVTINNGTTSRKLRQQQQKPRGKLFMQGHFASKLVSDSLSRTAPVPAESTLSDPNELLPEESAEQHASVMKSQLRSEERLANGAMRTQNRLAPVAPSPTHSPATFMHELTTFVEEQLQLLEKEFPSSSSSSVSTSAASVKQHAFLTTQEIEHRAIGSLTLTPEERKRKLRLDIFVAAQRMFTSSFPSYRLFLEALLDEHLRFDQFVLDDLAMHKEVITAQRQQLKDQAEKFQTKLQEKDEERKRLEETIASSQAHAEKLQRLLNEQANRDKKRDTDARRQLMEMEAAHTSVLEESRALKREHHLLEKQNKHLTINTFAEALDTANSQILDLRMQVSERDDRLTEEHDKLADIARDLKSLMIHFNQVQDLPLRHSDIRLSKAGMRVLFPEEGSSSSSK